MRNAILSSALLSGVLLAAACKPGAPPTSTATGGAARPAAATTAPNAAAPQGSRLSGSISPLSGSVTGFAVRTTDLGTVVDLAADVLFDFDKATLRPDAAAALTKTAALIRSGGTGPVAVVGYTDAKGDDAYNLALSRQRAQAVTDWLRGRPGMADHAFAASGKGEADPVAPNVRPDGSDDPTGRARNRRVQLVIPTA